MINKFAYSPEEQTQQTTQVYHYGLVQSTHKQQVDRESQLNSMFSQFQQDFTFEELMYFLDHQNRVPYDRNIAQQLFQECHSENQRIQARDFINQFLDTERNLNFRISYFESEKEELVKQKNELIKKLNQIKPNNVDRVILSIQSAKNLEPFDRFSPVDAFVQVIFDGQHMHSTQVLPNNQNPVWNEVFTLDIQPTGFLQSQKEIVLIVNDRKRLVVQDEIGRAVIYLKDLEKNMLVQKEDYLKKGDYRTQSTIAYEAKFVLSESKILQNDIRLKEEEIKQKIEAMKPTQITLAKLTQLFTDDKNPYQSNQLKQAAYNPSSNDLYKNVENSRNNQGGYGTGSGVYEQNNPVNMLNLSAYYFPNIKEQKFEQKILEKLDQHTSEVIEDWTKVTILFFVATTCFSIVQCLYKPQFLELTLLLIYMGLCFTGILTHTQHRFISIILIISWFYDVIWLIFLSTKWYGFEGYSNIDSGMRSFVILICIISTIFSKLPFVISMWRAYFKFDKYKEQIIKIKNKVMQLNNLGASNSAHFLSGSFSQQAQVNIQNQKLGGYSMQQQQQNNLFIQNTPNPYNKSQNNGLQNPYETQYHQVQVQSPQQYFQAQYQQPVTQQYAFQANSFQQQVPQQQSQHVNDYIY
ncbi:C2 domain protein (macronuclear) [Tetrahymena thermophila SB210]|uniref:C2 domain protein n=1 Tax=Tetrahymena thermophila (strain SB210) TaxID=312017 RepID=Q23FT6_TETTS|nr:C2 domain protein [Tetrahymena thermophila SB210]EAR95524.2 C2 domain protein [Tetrahymena thermophila SB210]|eukprot:XP_001015769.2 C2 domain protein [Tetrahymena thermophila SB210]